MIDYENLRIKVVKGLKKYLGCPVVRNNQNAEMPKYPFVSYTITTPMSANKGTHGEYADGKARKPIKCFWSITAQSDDNVESVTLANKARDWLDYVGKVYLNDNDVIVESVGNVGNRDNVLTTGYEYKNGFDVVFWLYDVVEMPEDSGAIEEVAFEEDINDQLESRLSGTESDYAFSSNQYEDESALNKLLENRLSGVEE